MGSVDKFEEKAADRMRGQLHVVKIKLTGSADCKLADMHVQMLWVR